MIISHDLNGNGYLINNEIWFNINSDSDVENIKSHNLRIEKHGAK